MLYLSALGFFGIIIIIMPIALGSAEVIGGGSAVSCFWLLLGGALGRRRSAWRCCSLARSDRKSSRVRPRACFAR